MGTKRAKPSKAAAKLAPAGKGRAKSAAKAAAPALGAKRGAKQAARVPVTPAAAKRSPVAKSGSLIRAGEPDFMSQLDRWFERSFGRLTAPLPGLPGTLFEQLGRSMDARTPRVDIVDRKSDVLVRAELPGIDKKDVRISLTEHTLSIRADATSEKKRQEGQFFHQEISRQSYERTIALPAGVDVDGARASLDNGVLEVSIPKRQSSAKKPLDIR